MKSVLKRSLINLYDAFVVMAIPVVLMCIARGGLMDIDFFLLLTLPTVFMAALFYSLLLLPVEAYITNKFLNKLCSYIPAVIIALYLYFSINEDFLNLLLYISPVALAIAGYYRHSKIDYNNQK